MTNYNLDTRPRFSAEITHDQARILNQILQHGMKKHLVQVVVQGIIAIYKKGGQPALGAIISEAISIDQMVSIGLQDTREAKIQTLEKKLDELRTVNNKCTHTWGIWHFVDESDEIYSLEDLESYRKDDEIQSEYTYCPDCGINLEELKK